MEHIGLTPESTPSVLTPESTTEFSLDNTFIGIFNPKKNLNCEEKGVRNYVTAEIPEWEMKNIPIELFSQYGFTYPNNYLLNKELDLLNFPDDEWLLCPIQLKDDSDEWDIQIGMSGKCKQDQSELDGMLLELEEELGFKYNSSDTVLWPLVTKHIGSWYDDHGHKKKYNYSRFTFKINLDNIKLIDKNVDKPITTVSDEDDYYRTIACIVCGKLRDIRKVLQIRKVDYSCSKDRIVGMAYVSVKTVKKVMARAIEVQAARDQAFKTQKEMQWKQINRKNP